MTALPPLPKIGPICYADAQSILEYRLPMVGSHLPGVRDVGLWTTDQLRAYGQACAEAERERCIERVKKCLYLDREGNVLPDANVEILRCVSALRGKMQKEEPLDMDGRC